MLLVISGGITLGILPFAILRMMQQDWAIAAMNLGIVLGTSFVFIHLLITKNAKVARGTIAVLTILAMSTTIFLKGAENVHWVYPALTTTFFLLSPKRAAWLTSVFLLLVIGMIWTQVDFLYLLTFTISAGATFLFSFAFSKRMHKQAIFLEHLATTDALTGVGNRRRLEEKLLEITRKIRRYPQQTCSLVFFDLDYFKRINDTHGHGCGDLVLQRFAEVMTSNIRDVDSFYRLGGEEFVLVLENTDLFAAKALAKKLGAQVERTKWHLDELKITTSAGIAQYDPKESSYDWMQRADEALYRAKDAGRNRFITSNDYSTS
ncbi:GGDEF domain-containing protein [Glaciecola siphonariae]|uniref:diguanylate cyclase n=1 Tax=Glaciecola siphonariae TaxID=521012 RepID=A0ABV9LTD3_9ALTE